MLDSRRIAMNKRLKSMERGAGLGGFLTLMCGSTDADTLFFQRRLRIFGDTELGLVVKNGLDARERPAR